LSWGTSVPTLSEKCERKLLSSSGRSDQGVSIIKVLDGAGSSHATITIQVGEINMRNRAVWFVVVAVLVSILVLAGTGVVIAAKEGAFGASGTLERSVSQETVVFGVTHVFIRNEAFSPSHIEVVLGTAVAWTNQDNVPHTLVLSPVVISAHDIWQSRLLYTGESFSYAFTSRGTFQYHCTEHPEMIGTVIVT
jgi:plastocyanin